MSSGERQVRLLLAGMTCSSCAATIEHAVKALPGVLVSPFSFAVMHEHCIGNTDLCAAGAKDVAVNVATGLAQVRFQAERLQLTQIREAVEAVGFEVLREEQSEATQAAQTSEATVILQIEGMSCTSCATTIEGALRDREGVKVRAIESAALMRRIYYVYDAHCGVGVLGQKQRITVSVPTSIASAVVELDKITVAEIIDTIESVGFGATHLETREMAPQAGPTTDRVTLAIEVTSQQIIKPAANTPHPTHRSMSCNNVHRASHSQTTQQSTLPPC